MNIRFLETAICLDELRNFRATADRLNITPAAISNRIAAMEQELGFRLFDRDSRDVRPTAEGSMFVGGARDIVDRYHDLVRSLHPVQEIAGTVRIGFLPSMAQALLPGIIGVLQKEFPNVRFSITTDTSTTMLQKLEAREIDAAICIAPPATAGFRVVDLCSLGMFWIADPRILTHAPDETLTIEDLLSYPIISYAVGTHNHKRLMAYFADTLSEVSIVHHSNSLATTINLVSMGMGVSVLPPVSIQRELRDGSLCVLKVQPTFPPTKYSMIQLDRDDENLGGLVTKIAREVTAGFCGLYDDSLATVI
jgi:DNA-binding transcriptional LysR family regulator